MIVGDDASLNKSIQYNSVDFSYGSKKILNKINLDIKAGEFISIVGPSGGGKTTLTDMLLRFNEPENGEIMIDGKDITKLNKSSLRS